MHMLMGPYNKVLSEGQQILPLVNLPLTIVKFEKEVSPYPKS